MDRDKQATLTGVAISIGGNVVISLALNLQKLAHARSARPLPSPGPPESRPSLDDEARSTPSEETPLLLATEPNPWASQPSLTNKGSQTDAATDSSSGSSGSSSAFLRSPLWWLGLLALSVGELGNFVSYSYAPASVVAPLGTAALVANWVFAPLILGERFRSQDTLGVGLAIIGAGTIVLSSRTSQPALDPPALVRALRQPAFIAYSSVVAAAIGGLAVLSEYGFGARHLLVDIVLCALLGGWTVLATKTVSSLLLNASALTQPVFWAALAVLVVTALGQLRYLNKALSRFSSKHVVPAQFACFTLAVLVGSGVLYRDFDDVSPRRFATFLLGLTTTLLGVKLLTPGGPATAPTDDDDGDEGAGEGEHSGQTTPVDGGAEPPASNAVDLSSPTRGRAAPLPPTLHLPSSPSPSAVPIARTRSPSAPGSRPRLRRLSTASVRGFSAGGLLLSSSLGRTAPSPGLGLGLGVGVGVPAGVEADVVQAVREVDEDELGGG